MASQWYYKLDEDVRGPFSPAELKELANKGLITPESRVKNSKLPKWVRARRVEGLFRDASSSLSQNDLIADREIAQPLCATPVQHELKATPADDLKSADIRPKTTTLSESGRVVFSNQKVFGGLVALVILGASVFFATKSSSITPAVSKSSSWFPERRAGISRDDVRQTLREMEAEVPNTLREMERNLPSTMADLERGMMKDANKFGLSQSEVQSQLREIENGARQQIRGMESEVKQQIRGMEDDVMRELQRIERGQ